MTSSKPSGGVRSFTKTFRKVYPKHFLRQQIKRSQVDRYVRKLFFVNFILFLIVVVLLRPSCLATRDLEAKSQQFYIQHLTGISTAAHSSIAERLARLPPDLMDTMLNQAQQYLKSQCHWKAPIFPRLKVFDTTTWSVSAKHFDWAANNGKRNAARFVFVMDARTGGIERIIDAHISTSDNDVFEAVIRDMRRGETFVFDRGYNRFTTLKRIVQQGGHFVTRWKKNYSWKGRKRRKLPANTQLPGQWQLVSDTVGTAGTKDNPGQLEARRIVCWHPATEMHPEKWFILWTDLMHVKAKKIVRIYVARWPIEVFFRHIKSKLRTVYFPTRSPAGVHNWLVIIALSVVFMLIMTASDHKDRVKSLGEPTFPFLAYWRQLEVAVMNELFTTRFESPPWPPPHSTPEAGGTLTTSLQTT